MIAPGRARRPGAHRWRLDAPSDEELEACPFCAGHEDRTPPETLRLPKDGPWQVRVFPNLYPAFEAHEVVAHAPRHARSLVELADTELDLVAEAWQRRAGEHDGYLHAFVNEGAEAGSSLPHTHSQLVWLGAPPPEVARERRESCPLCPPPGGAELVVARRDGVVLRVAWAARAPYELLVAPLAHEPDPWASDRLAPALQLAADGLRRLHALEGPCPVNLWLHAPGDHWHVELVPRLAVLAGVELGAGIFVNTLDPAEAARRLRAAGA